MAKTDSAESSRSSTPLFSDDDPGLGLFASGGTFEAFPGAVLVAAYNGIVLSSNEEARPIADLLKSGAPDPLRAAIAAALAGQAAQINPLLVESGDEEVSAKAYDLAVLPWGEGTAVLLLGRDVTLERSLRSALVQSQQRCKGLLDLTGDFFWETDAAGRFVFVPENGALGYTASELVGREAATLLADPVRQEPSPFSTKCLARCDALALRRAEGPMVLVTVKAAPLFSPEGSWVGARGICRA